MTNFSKDMDELQDHLKRIEKLAKDRGQILPLPPQKALNEILEHPQPHALVHSFAEEDFYFLVHDIGPEDSLELLSLASDRQWEYLLDLETWRKDLIDINAVTHWLHLLLQADPDRFTHWAFTQKPELIEYYMFKTCDIRVREYDQDPSEMGDNFVTLDDIFYIKLPEAEEDPDADAGINEKQNAFLTQILKRLADVDHVLYQQTLLRAANVIPSENEEEFFRLRNVRLAEKGFQPFNEAVGIYQPIRIKEIKRRKKILSERPSFDTFVPVPLNHQALMEKDNIFSRALSCISLQEAFDQVQIEFAGLCNQIISADQLSVHDREELRSVVKKACGYLSIGLERISNKHRHLDDCQLAGQIKRYPLVDIFRIGFGLVTHLKQKAEKWRKNSWFENNGLALSFWGERLVGVLGGLLIKRPRFFDNYKTGELYRDFETMSDVRQTRAALKEAMAFDDLLSFFSINTQEFPKDFFITYKNLLLTLWARHQLRLPKQLHPIPFDQFKLFFADLWEKEGKGASVKEIKKNEFLKWLAKESGFAEDEISKKLGKALENLFTDIAEEYGNVSLKDLDPRFVHMFMIAGK